MEVDAEQPLPRSRRLRRHQGRKVKQRIASVQRACAVTPLRSKCNERIEDGSLRAKPANQRQGLY
eukprot:13202152-Alexandrium_andersonii.AAC.1